MTTRHRTLDAGRVVMGLEAKMKKHFQYLWYVIHHKWCVFIECCKLGIPWRGIVHDLSKFSLSEWLPCANYFDDKRIAERPPTGYYKSSSSGSDAFDFSRLLHHRRNKHEWRWWVLPDDDGGVRAFRMEKTYLLEMLADWYGAARAQGLHRDSVPEWYRENKHKMHLHPETRWWIENQLTRQ